jgi:hypothetical protein
MGFFSDTIDQIRLVTNEPSLDAKYSDAELVSLISQAFYTVWNEINRVSTHQVVIRTDISVTATQQRYILPPSMTKLVDIQRLNDDGSILCRYNPSNIRNPAWPNLRLEGNTLYFTEATGAAYTLRLLWIPSGYVALHYGTLEDITNNTDDCDVTLATTPTGGTRDLRPNAYAGCMFRILTSGGDGEGAVQDRIIHTYDPQTKIAVVEPAYESGMVPEATITYEITPMRSDELVMPIAEFVSRKIVGWEGDYKRYRTIDLDYKRDIRTARLLESCYDLIQGHYMRIDTARVPKVIPSTLQRLDGHIGAL